MKSNFWVLIKDLRLFLKIWYRFLFRRVYKGFSRFEKAKGFIAQGLYRQRGRFARPFVHAAMGGIVGMAVTLAPVLANSFPGVEKDLALDQPPAVQIMSTATEDATSTQVSDKVRDKVLDYEVQPGDTVSSIAVKFGISTDTIRWENSLASVNSIKPGQHLRILPVTGVLHKVTRGETIYTIAKKYDANPQAIVDFPFNNFADNETFALAVGQELIVPDGKKPNEIPWSPTLYVAQRTPNAGVVAATGQFAWPMSGVITQRFSWYHGGVDVATAFGTPILAADSGKVLVAGWPDNSGYGNRVVIDHGNGYVTWYGHMSKILVVAGQTVKRGDQIGLEGSTGRSTGPHLHFEIRRGNTHFDPLLFLK
jgi:murein DD-endopeptidase MepM/ murein hydrolase activator NlpD